MNKKQFITLNWKLNWVFEKVKVTDITISKINIDYDLLVYKFFAEL